MNQIHRALYERILAFPLDEPGSQFTFTQRLARENGWDLAYAKRVIDEYKKFMFLAVAAGHPVSPSDQVDQAWHLHMTYTHSYWEGFCRQVLGKPLHHEPTQGGRGEQRKFASWYEKTLGSYRLFFGEESPRDIWPETRVRFNEDIDFERVNRRRSVILPRRTLKGLLAIFMIAAGLLLVVAFGHRVARAFESAMNLHGPDFLGFYALTFVAVLAGGLVFRRTQRKPSDDPVGAELDLHPYEVAYLAGDEKRAANAAIASLVERKILGAMPAEHKIKRAGSLPDDAHPLERALLQATGVGPGSKVSDLHGAAQPALEEIRSRLVSLGLVVSETRDCVARAVPILVIIAMSIFGLEKVSVGHDRHRPVGFLVLLVLGAGISGLVIFGRRLRRSRRGDRAVAKLRHEYGELEIKAARAAEAGMTSLEIPMAAGLFGVAALAGGPFDALKETLQPPSVSSGAGGGGGGGCGAGCGGGGCGGGCGGCGGCSG